MNLDAIQLMLFSRYNCFHSTRQVIVRNLNTLLNCFFRVSCFKHSLGFSLSVKLTFYLTKAVTKMCVYDVCIRCMGNQRIGMPGSAFVV